MKAPTITEQQVWSMLNTISDPEIPAISILDLGIVRHVSLSDEGALHLVITPTYSGCPAMSMIAMEIRMRMRAVGLENVKIETQLSPVWTTDWLSKEGRKKLKHYGIAPPTGSSPHVQSLFGDAPEVECPRCGASHTKRISEFGSTACKALYQCQECKEPFDYFKCH